MWSRIKQRHAHLVKKVVRNCFI